MLNRILKGLRIDSLCPVAHEGRIHGVYDARLMRFRGSIVREVLVSPKADEDGFAEVTVCLFPRLPTWLLRRFWNPEHFTVDTAAWGHYATVRLGGVPIFSVANPVEQCVSRDDADRIAGRVAYDVHVSDAYVETAPAGSAMAYLTLRQPIAEMGKLNCGADATIVWESLAVRDLHVPNPEEVVVHVEQTALFCEEGDGPLYAVSVDGGVSTDEGDPSRTALAFLRRPRNHGLDATKFERDEAFSPCAYLDYDGAMGAWAINLRDRWIPCHDPAPTMAPNPEVTP